MCASILSSFTSLFILGAIEISVNLLRNREVTSIFVQKVLPHIKRSFDLFVFN